MYTKLLLAISILISGCNFVPITTNLGSISDVIVAWKNGEAEQYYEHSSTTIYKATKRVLIKQNIEITEDDYRGNGNYCLIAGNGDRFRINIINKNNNITCVKIRVNIFGDQQYAELIYKGISEEVLTATF